MDTIKTKIYQLHQELTSALFEASSAQATSDSHASKAKELELKQRDLMKAISSKENDLDKMLEQLEKVERQTREKVQLRETADEDKNNLAASIAVKEAALKKCQEDLERNGVQMTAVTTRGDAVERSRKEVEHRVQSLDDALDRQEQQLRDARYLTDEASRKHDEATFKIDKLQRSLDRSLARADTAEAKVERLEADLKGAGDALTDGMARKEKSARREEQLKKQIRHLAQQLEEAESRAEAEKEEENKWQGRADFLKKTAAKAK